ncbi:MAG: histidine kinase [Bacteroidetes bacterium]|nr:histidine kinase [Bacteroidota bacterium]
MKQSAASFEKLNDIGFRLILIPFFGIAIPLITKINDEVTLTHWLTKFSYGYTILIAFVIWQGNRYLLFTLRTYFDWFNKPIKKIIYLLLAISFYTIPISTLLLTGWYYIFAQGKVNWSTVYTTTLIIMICVIFITHVYETVFLVKESESEMVKNEQLEKARAQAELEALKNQVDPHFIFNSLNTLSHLIEENPAKAKLFNDNMAEVFRYILQNKSQELVLLREEVFFLRDYFSLLKIRFEDAVQMNLDIPPNLFDNYLIPPISLQLLIENAIKHNEFSDHIPLIIDIDIHGEELHVKNEIRKKILRKTSGTGLYNLNERYKLLTNKSIEINEDKEFIVSLPLLKIT